jgi:hypothetical protein
LTHPGWQPALQHSKGLLVYRLVMTWLLTPALRKAKDHVVAPFTGKAGL